MLTFKTQFALNDSRQIDDVIDAGRIWLAGSPHSALAETLAQLTDIEDGYQLTKGAESIVFHRHDGDEQLAAFRHENIDGAGVHWVTEVVAAKCDRAFWLAIQLSADSELPVEKVDPGKRPYILKTVMERIGGGMDHSLPVTDKPHYLSDDEIELAAALMTGRAGCVMPIVYVSVNNHDKTHINPEQLAKWLSGMAHVVVEPSRGFAFELMAQVDNANAYGGAVAIYWPDSLGRWLFMPKEEYVHPHTMQRAIAQKVRKSLLSQRTRLQCRWGFLQEKLFKARLQALKASGSDSVEDYAELFDKELEAKDDEIQKLEAEIARLKYGAWEAEKGATHHNTLNLHGDEKDLYQAERQAIVIEALSVARDAAEEFSRRKDILTDLIEKNSEEGEREAILQTLKNLLRKYRSMSAADKKTLETVGFSISEEGKHYKLIFRNDQRYSFTLSKSGSDNRGGLNAFTDLKRRLF